MNKYIWWVALACIGCISNNYDTTRGLGGTVSEKERHERLAASEVHFGNSIKIPKTDYYIYPVSTQMGGSGRWASSSKGGYSSGRTWNMVFYNPQTREKHLLVDDVVPIILDYPKASYWDTLGHLGVDPGNSGRDKDGVLFFQMCMTDFNKNGIIDSDDPKGLFVSRLDGRNLRRISPETLNLSNWKFLDEEKSLIELICDEDSDNDEHFGSEKDERKVLVVDLDSLVNDYTDVFPQSYKDKLKQQYIKGMTAPSQE